MWGTAGLFGLNFLIRSAARQLKSKPKEKSAAWQLKSKPKEKFEVQQILKYEDFCNTNEKAAC
jgi:hypothetical protein